ncbi:MAG: hypothetical protein AAGA93_17535 [Actinomycetota bacterium]
MTTLSTRTLARLLAVLLATALVAAACGDDDTSTESADATASSSSSASASASASASETADEASASASEPAEGGAGDDGATVTVTDMTGEITVPVIDENVLALDEYAAIALLTLGITPETTAQFYGDFYDAGENAIIEASGTSFIPPDNLEALALASPALMVGIGHPNFEPFVDEHREIAPSVYPMFTSRWEEQTQVFAQVTGTEERAAAVTAAVAVRTEEVREAIEAAGLTGAEVSLIQTFPGEFYSYSESPLAGSVIKDLGFTRPPLQLEGDEFGFVSFSEEDLPSQTQADIVIWIDAAFEGSLFDNPLVDMGDRIAVSAIPSWTANHALGAWIMLEDVERAVTGQPPLTPGADVAAVWSELLAAIDAQA